MPEEEKSQEWIFTFGSNHIWPLTGEMLMRHFVVLNGTFEGTRQEMLHRFGNRWANQYASRESAGVNRFRLTELKLEKVKEEYRCQGELRP